MRSWCRRRPPSRDWQSYINRSDAEGTVKVLLGGPERAKPTLVDAATGTYEYAFCTPLATVSSFIYYGNPATPATNCSSTVVANAGEMTSAAWAAVQPTIDVSYQPAAPTRVTIVGRDGSLVNVVQDFVPSALPALSATMAAEVVTNASCGACHAEDVEDRTQLLIMRTKAEKGGGHLGRRYQVEVCVMCHNATGFDPATSTDAAWNTLDLKALVHELHVAEYPQNSPFGGVSNIGAGFAPGANPLWAQLGLPGLPGVYNCRTCHDNQNAKILPFQPADRAVADKDAWKVNITQQACNSCHVVDFTNHFGAQPDNAQCALCHGTDRSLPVNLAHATPYSTPNNPELYPGAKSVEYAIQSVTVDAATASRRQLLRQGGRRRAQPEVASRPAFDRRRQPAPGLEQADGGTGQRLERSCDLHSEGLEQPRHDGRSSVLEQHDQPGCGFPGLRPDDERQPFVNREPR